MPTISQPSGRTAWRELYVAALYEADTTKRLGRIADAQKALVLRARELFQATGDNIEEAEALDDAMYALRALRNTYQNGHTIEQSAAAA